MMRDRLLPDDDEMPDVQVISRKQFVEQFGKDYKPGQHVTIMGPSGRGKTELGGQLLVSVSRYHSEIETRILHGKIKGRDLTIERLSKRGRFPIVSDHKPTKWQTRWYKWRTGKKPRGFIVRPLEKPMESPEAENKYIASKFRRTIYRAYHSKLNHPVNLVVDEAHQAHNDLGLRKDCEGPLMRGRPVCAVWSFIQRGRYVSYMVYDQAEHLLIFFDPDRDNQRRYSEIGGVDPDVLIELSKRLKTKTVADGSTISQCIYFRRSGGVLLIVDF